jgi:hypothetical protein
MDAPRADVATPRRRFLRILALAPAAAACAGASHAAKAPAAAPSPEGSQSPGVTGAALASTDPLAPIRGFPLPAGSEPAFVFRAAPARPRI